MMELVEATKVMNAHGTSRIGSNAMTFCPGRK
jgi:hypothetical protein